MEYDVIYPTHVRAQVRGRHIDMELSEPYVVLLGDNEAGKTAVMNAVELALTGGASEVGLTPWTTSPAVLADLAGPAGYLSSEVTWSDGSKSTYRQEGTKRGVRAGPEGVALQSVVAEITASKARAARWMLDHAKVTDDEMLEVIGHTEGQQLFRATKGSSLAERLEHTEKEARRTRNARKTRADQAEAALKAKAAWLPTLPTEAQLAEAHRAYEDAFAALDEEGRHQVAAGWQPLPPPSADAVEAARKAAEEAQGLVLRLTQRMSAAQQLVATMGQSEDPHERSRYLAGITHALQRQISHHPETCLICGSSVAQGFARNRLATVAEAQAQLQAHVDAARELEVAEADLRRAVQQRDHAQASYERLKSGLRSERHEAWAAAAALREGHTELQSVVKLHAEVKALEAAAWKAKAAHESSRAALKAVVDAASVLAARAIRDLEGRVSAHLLPGERFAFEEGRIGIAKDGRTVWTFTGSQHARLLGALIGALSSDRMVLTLPDRGWDKKHLGQAVKALSGINVPFLLPSTVKPSRAPATVQVVDVAAHVAAEAPEETPEEPPEEEVALTEEVGDTLDPLPADAPAWVRNCTRSRILDEAEVAWKALEERGLEPGTASQKWSPPGNKRVQYQLFGILVARVSLDGSGVLFKT